jgi:hypothetical protein
LTPREATPLFEDLEVGTLADNKVPTIYSLGFTERAKRLQAGVKKTHRWLERLFKIDAKTYLAVLDDADWRASCIPPYGRPHTVWDGPRGFLVASYDYHDAMIDAMLRIVAQAPPKLEREFRKLRGADEKNIERFMDLIVTAHEVCHLFIDQRKLAMGPDWLPEMFSHYLTYAYLRQTDPADAKAWKLCEDIWASQGELQYSKLEDYEMHHPDMPLENYIWFQGKFNQRGVDLYNRMGVRFANRIVEEFAVTDQEVYRRLNDISSDWGRWIGTFG